MILEVVAWPDPGERPFIATRLIVEDAAPSYLASVKDI